MCRKCAIPVRRKSRKNNKDRNLIHNPDAMPVTFCPNVRTRPLAGAIGRAG
jgi:hypothetical protein